MVILEVFLALFVLHVGLNIIMKMVKSTDFGHKLLSAAYSVGFTMGCKGEELNKALAIFMEFWIGPESVLEYRMGLSAGQNVSKRFTKENERERYLELRNALISKNFERMPERRKAIVKDTPVLNSMILHARGEVNSGLEKRMLKYSQPKGKQPIMGYILLAVVSVILILLSWHLLFQLVISTTRVIFSKTKRGKRFLMQGFIDGLKGHKMPWYKRMAYDYLASPAVLDTLRIGHSVRELGFKS